MATTNCPARLDWREDGRLGFRDDIDLDWLRDFLARYGAPICHAFRARTPLGEVTLIDGLVRDADGTLIDGAGPPESLFLRVADRACRGLRSYVN